MPHVARFSIAPVRSLGLEHPTEIDVTERGVVEDRRFYFYSTTRTASSTASSSGGWSSSPAYTDPDATILRMTFPDGSVIEDEVKLGDPVETHIHGRTGSGTWSSGRGPGGADRRPADHRRPLR